jgi:lipid-binding SYLF domain-containing protein
MKHLIAIFLAFSLLPYALPAQAASTTSEQQAAIQDMRKTTLDTLHKLEPAAKDEIEEAYGYAVFTSADIAAVFVSGGYGHGVSHNNRTGADTYMQMASAGVGIGIGAKDFSTVLVFSNEASYREFIQTGLDLSANIDLAAKQGSKGDAATGADGILPGVRIYQFTETGLLAQAMLKGTKFWPDQNLNN